VATKGRGDELRRKSFAAAEDRIGGPWGALADQRCAVENFVKLLEDQIDRRRDLLDLLVGDEAVRSLTVAPPDRLDQLLVLIACGQRRCSL
jgi:hypothetical protein